MKMFLKRSFWAMLTIYLALWLVISMVAGIILEDYKNVINSSLGLTGYRTETITTEGEDLEYFKSKFVQYDADGNILYVTDENGYTHQVYDDVALREAALEKAYQVQREGSTILWNTENGLPLAEGNKVKAVVRFKGREMAHTDLGREVILKFQEALAGVGNAEKKPVLEGRYMSIVLSPVKQDKK